MKERSAEEMWKRSGSGFLPQSVPIRGVVRLEKALPWLEPINRSGQEAGLKVVLESKARIREIFETKGALKHLIPSTHPSAPLSPNRGD